MPALVHLADHRVVIEFEVVEELLAELDRPVDLLDPAQGDAGAVDGHQEHRQALVLGYVPVRASQQQPVVRRESTCAPGLCAVDHPLVADVIGPGDDAGKVRTAAGFRQQLHEHFLAAQRARNVLALLLFAAGVEDRRCADRERRRVEDHRHFIVARLGVECLLVRDGQAETAVVPRKADTRESAFVELLLKLAGATPGRILAAIVIRWIGRVDARHVLRQPHPGARGEFFDRLGRFGWRRRRLGHDAGSSCSVSA